MESCLNMGKKNHIPDSLNYDFCFHCDNRVKKILTCAPPKNIKMLLNSELRHAHVYSSYCMILAMNFK